MEVTSNLQVEGPTDIGWWWQEVRKDVFHPYRIWRMKPTPACEYGELMVDRPHESVKLSVFMSLHRNGKWHKATMPIGEETQMEVIIKSISGSSRWKECVEHTEVYVDGKMLDAYCTYRGEPEDNYRSRHYSWVEPLLKKLAEKLGAKATIVEEDRGERDDW